MKNFLEDKFIELGFTESEYRFIRSSGLVMLLSDTDVKNNLEYIFKYFQELNFDNNTIIKLFKLTPALLILTPEKIDNHIKYLLSLGYSKENIISMIKKSPNIIMLSENEIENRIYQLSLIGYTKENIIKMGKNTPQIYTYQLNRLKDKLAFLISLNYKKDEVIKMTSKLSSLFIYGYENIENKIDFLNSINAHYLPVYDPNVLQQNPKISYARYEYLKENNIDYSVSHFRKLFMSEKQFIKQYKITNDELLANYCKTNDKQKKY